MIQVVYRNAITSMNTRSMHNVTPCVQSSLLGGSLWRIRGTLDKNSSNTMDYDSDSISNHDIMPKIWS